MIVIIDLNLPSKMRHLYLLLPLIFLAPIHLNAGVAEDQKRFYDILIITNPIQNSEYREELFTSNIDGLKPFQFFARCTFTEINHKLIV